MKLNLSQIYNLGDLALYKPNVKRPHCHYYFMLFLISKSAEKVWWCGWFDPDNRWREGLIPENKMIKIND